MEQLIFSIMLLISWPNPGVSFAVGITGQPPVVVPISYAGAPTAFLRGLLSAQASGNGRDGLRQSAREHGERSRLSIPWLNAKFGGDQTTTFRKTLPIKIK